MSGKTRAVSFLAKISPKSDRGHRSISLSADGHAQLDALLEGSPEGCVVEVVVSEVGDPATLKQYARYFTLVSRVAIPMIQAAGDSKMAALSLSAKKEYAHYVLKQVVSVGENGELFDDVFEGATSLTDLTKLQMTQWISAVERWYADQGVEFSPDQGEGSNPNHYDHVTLPISTH